MKDQLLIIIAQNAWIFVGRCTREADEVVIKDARNIRRWGTSTGLGELALKGPRSETVLDSYGVVRVPVLGVIASLECNEKAWTK